VRLRARLRGRETLARHVEPVRDRNEGGARQRGDDTPGAGDRRGRDLRHRGGLRERERQTGSRSAPASHGVSSKYHFW